MLGTLQNILYDMAGGRKISCRSICSLSMGLFQDKKLPRRPSLENVSAVDS